jgi:hypothetical protein
MEHTSKQDENLIVLARKLTSVHTNYADGIAAEYQVLSALRDLKEEATRYNWRDGERSSFSQEMRDLLPWYVIEAMSMKAAPDDDTKAPTRNEFEKFWPRATFDTERLKIEMKINDVEVPFREVFAMLNEQYRAIFEQIDARVEDKARILIKLKHKQIYDALDKLYDATKEVADEAERKMRAAFPDSWRSSSNDCESLD